MLGNVCEWCDNTGAPYAVPPDAVVRKDLGDEKRAGKPLVRGGHFGSSYGSVRAAKRTVPSSTTNTIGFRIVRTMPADAK